MGENHHLGIDIGGTKTKFAKVYSDGTMKQTQKVNTPKDLTGFINQIDHIYNLFDSDDISSVAISLPGKVDSEEGVVYFGGSLPFLHEFNFKKHFRDRYKKNCTVINDGKAAALCELWLGNLRGINNGLVITLGTGVGGGIILDGKLYQGTNFQAGEFSFLNKNVFDVNLESIQGFKLSAVNFIETCSNLLGHSKPYDGEKVFDEIKKNANADLTELFQNYIRAIVNLIINLQVVLDVEKVLIGGGISEQSVLIDEINRQYDSVKKESTLYGEMIVPVVIDTCAFKNNSNILGAVFAHIDHTV